MYKSYIWSLQTCTLDWCMQGLVYAKPVLTEAGGRVSLHFDKIFDCHLLSALADRKRTISLSQKHFDPTPYRSTLWIIYQGYKIAKNINSPTTPFYSVINGEVQQFVALTFQLTSKFFRTAHSSIHHMHRLEGGYWSWTWDLHQTEW